MQNTSRIAPTSFPRAFSITHPSLPNVLSFDTKNVDFDGVNYPPPLSTTLFTAYENMNSSPHLLRSSMYVIPCESTTLNSVGMPLYITLQPFYPCIKNIVDKVIQCTECSSYINSYTRYEGDGNYICNICNKKNKINDYKYDSHATLEYTFKQTELKDDQNDYKKEKEELFVCDDYFSWRIFRCPILLLGLQANKFYQERIDSCIELLKDDNFDLAFGKVCIFNFNDDITVYKNIDGIEEYVSCDMLPFISPDFFCDKMQALEILEYLKENVKIVEHKINPHVLSFVLKASRYSFGKALLFVDEQVNVPFEFQSKLMDNSFVLNIVTTYESVFSELIKTGCGKILNNSLLSIFIPTYYDVNLEIKTSDSLSKSKILTHIPLDNTLLLHYPSMDSNTVIGCSFDIDESTKEGQQVFIQAILRYTEYDEKKLIVINHGFLTSNNLTNIFSGFTFDTIFHYFARVIAEDLTKFTMVKTSIIKAFRLYRHLIAKNVTDSQMVLPDNLKLLPLLYSSLLKRSRMLHFCSTLSTARVLRLFYPRIFSLTDFMLTSEMILLNATFSSLSENDIYVFDNGLLIIIYIGRNINITEDEFPKEEKEVIQNIQDFISNEYNEHMNVDYIKMGQGDLEVNGMMVEDKMNDVSSYGDFLIELHHLIKY